MPKRLPKPPEFTAKQACIAIDMPRGTLNRWMHDGVLRHAQEIGTTAGKARRFTLNALCALGITKKLFDMGLAATQAYQWANLAVRYFDAHYTKSPHLFKELNIYFTREGEIVFPELAGEPVPSDAHTRLTIFPTAIFDEIRARLEGAEASDANG